VKAGMKRNPAMVIRLAAIPAEGPTANPLRKDRPPESGGTHQKRTRTPP
jgi:hypothetical protein